MHDGVYPTQLTYVTKKLCQLKVHFDCLKFAIFVNVIYVSAIQQTMMKSNTEKQRDYREWKKLEGPDFLEKECKRQKDNYVKTSSLSKKELQERRMAVKERVQRSRDCKRTLLEKIQNEMSYASSLAEADIDQTMSPSPMLISIPFPKRVEAS